MDPRYFTRPQVKVGTNWKNASNVTATSSGRWAATYTDDYGQTRKAIADAARLRDFAALPPAVQQVEICGGPEDAGSRNGVSIDDDGTINASGTYSHGDPAVVVQGSNDEWYVVRHHELAMADPLNGLDTIQGTGWPTLHHAALAWALTARQQK